MSAKVLSVGEVLGVFYPRYGGCVDIRVQRLSMIGGMGRPLALCMLMGRQCGFSRLLWRCTLVLVKEKVNRCTCVLEVVVLEVCLHQAVWVSTQTMWASVGTSSDWGRVERRT